MTTLAWRYKGVTMTIVEVLDRCLDEIGSGRASVDDCLRRYPEFADDLRPLLRTANRLETAGEVRAPRAFKSNLRKQLTGEEPRAYRFSWRLLFLWLFLSAIAVGALIWLGITFQAAGGSFTPLPPMTWLIPWPSGSFDISSPALDFAFLQFRPV